MIHALSLTLAAGAWQANSGAGLPWWAWVLIILALVVIVVLLMRRQPLGAPPADFEEPTHAQPAIPPAPCPPTARPAMAEPPAASDVLAPTATTDTPPVQPDDLSIIEGIGPKIAGILQAAGITTFAQLAVVDADRLQGILAQAGLAHLADASTWGEQAALAAAGKWDDFEKLTQQLKGGRRA